VTKFIVDNGAVLSSVNTSLQDSLAAVRGNVDWMEERGNAMVSWMNANLTH
jgi:hypothetical protein